MKLQNMDEEAWQNVLKRMKHQLQALAMPSKIQLGLLPDFVCKGDDLADSYAHWSLYLLSNDDGRLMEEQRLALSKLDHYFDKMSGQANAQWWTDEAMRNGQNWADVRNIAIELLNIFDWPVEIPKEPI